MVLILIICKSNILKITAFKERFIYCCRNESPVDIIPCCESSSPTNPNMEEEVAGAKDYEEGTFI